MESHYAPVVGIKAKLILVLKKKGNMQKKTLLLISALMLSACATKPKEVPVCTGSTLRGCQPVVYFDIGSVALNAKAKSNLDWAYEKMVRFPRENITAIGYADSTGDAERNFTLSKQRAKAVKDYLVKKGVAADRIDVAFQGEFEPVCTKADCQYLNRRVELKFSRPNGGFEPIDWDEVGSKIKGFFCDEE